MPPFSFVHSADLHLDSPFLGLKNLSDSHQKVLEILRNATFEAYREVIDLCISRQVDFLLVAGDVYDGASRSIRAEMRFRDGLQRLAEHGIRAYVVHGNHDPLDGWSHSLKMPEQVHVFHHRLESVVQRHTLRHAIAPRKLYAQCHRAGLARRNCGEEL